MDTIASPTRARRPSRSAGRTAGWLTAALLVAAAAFPGSSLAGNPHGDDNGRGNDRESPAPVPSVDPAQGNPTCLDLDATWTLSYKIDTGSLQDGAYPPLGPVVSSWNGQVITLSNVTSGGQVFDWSSTQPVLGILVKAGNGNNGLYLYPGGATTGIGLTHGAGQQGISHVLFCGGTSQPSTDPSPSASVSPSPSTDPSPSASVSPSPSTDPSPSERPSVPPSERPSIPPSESPSVPATPTPTGEVGGVIATPAPTGEVDAVAGTPQATLPPTDSLGGDQVPVESQTWRFVLLGVAIMLISLLVLPTERATVRAR